MCRKGDTKPSWMLADSGLTAHSSWNSRGVQDLPNTNHGGCWVGLAHPGFFSHLLHPIRNGTSASLVTCWHSSCLQEPERSLAPQYAQGGNLLIPLHGYPLTNAASFPRRIDFGRVAIGECAARRVALGCRVPMQFEFSIRVVKPSRAFSVRPMSGVVPAGGAAEVEVEFRPVALQTDEMRIEVNWEGGWPVAVHDFLVFFAGVCGRVWFNCHVHANPQHECHYGPWQLNLGTPLAYDCMILVHLRC